MNRLRGPTPVRHRAALLIAAVCIAACGSLLTEVADDGDVFDAPLSGLTGDELAAFVRGDEEFGRLFTAADGLGPIFNETSCATCHSGDGRGDPRSILSRIGEPSNGFLSTLGGPQIQTRSLPGVPAEAIPDGHAVSRRLPPPVFGMGLIEAIPEDAILALADSLDADGDGISGRPNWVNTSEFLRTIGAVPSRRIGRFGRKAQVATLLEQVVEAYHQDMGITTEFRPQENLNPAAPGQTHAADHVADPEISTATVLAVIHYIQGLAAPAPGAMTPVRVEGETLFTSVGCTSCHVASLRTGDHAIGALRNTDVLLYSDLLLHDMGDGLADNRSDGSATGREWRTAPLWGTRLVRQFLNGDGFFLHDGRARTLDEAIRLHGGEAARARDAYIALTAAQRAAVLDFVGSR